MSMVHTAQQVFLLLQDLERRSRLKSANLSPQDDLDSSLSVVGFRIDSYHFLLPLTESREIFPLPSQITPVPMAQPWVYGIVNIRGELLPIYDLKHFLFEKKTTSSNRSRIMIVNQPDVNVGFLVDEVLGLKLIQQETGPVASSCPANIVPFLNGSVSNQDQQWNVFSFHKLISDKRFENVSA